MRTVRLSDREFNLVVKALQTAIPMTAWVREVGVNGHVKQWRKEGREQITPAEYRKIRALDSEIVRIHRLLRKLGAEPLGGPLTTEHVFSTERADLYQSPAPTTKSVRCGARR